MFYLLFFLFASVPLNGKNHKHTKTNFIDITSPADSVICLILLNNQLFLSTINNMQLIDKENILSIKMYSPEEIEYKSIIKNIKMRNEKIKKILGYFVIETKKSIKLPKTFTTKNIRNL